MNRHIRLAVLLAEAVWLGLAACPAHGGDDANEPSLADGPAVLSAAQLGRLTFASKLDPNLHGSQLDANDYRKLAVAVRMSKRRYAQGEPIWAYFVVHNRSRERLGLDMAFDPTWKTVINSWNIHISRADGGEPAFRLRLREWRCGRPLMVIDANGFACARADLRRLAHKLPVRPGEYRICWDYARLRSNTETFTVTAEGGATPRPADANDLPARVRVVRLHTQDPNDPKQQMQKAKQRDHERVRRQQVRVGAVRPLWAQGVMANLVTGVAGRYYPDLLDLPTVEGGIRCESLKAVTDANGLPKRLTVKLAPAKAGTTPYLPTEPELYLIALGEAPLRQAYRDEVQALARLAKAGSWADVDEPFTLHIDLPADWADRVGLGGRVRVAVVLASEELECFRHGLKKLVRVLYAEGNTPWRGVIRSPYIDIRLPMARCTPKPAAP